MASRSSSTSRSADSDGGAGPGPAEEGRARRDYRPEGVAPDPGLLATLKRTATEFNEDKLTIWAAALTYYGLLSLFPALIAMVSLIGIFGDPKSTTRSIMEIIGEIGPAS